MKVVILAAMDKEMALLRNLVENAKDENVENVKVVTGLIGRHEVVLAKCGIGKVNAALNTYKIIKAYAPEIVINSGVAGGAGGLHVGDLLVAGEVAYHDVWCGPGTDPGAADGFSRIFKGDAEVLAIADSKLGHDGVSYGLIATGDIFISRVEEIARIKEIFPQAVAVDMESAAIMQTCVSEGVRCSIVRVVSDTPGEAENVSQYVNFWSEAPAKTFHALEQILSGLQ